MKPDVEPFQRITDVEKSAAYSGGLLGCVGSMMVLAVRADEFGQDTQYRIESLRNDIIVLEEAQQDEVAAYDSQAETGPFQRAISNKQTKLQTLKSDKPIPPSTIEIGGMVAGPIALGVITFTAVSAKIRRVRYNRLLSKASSKFLNDIEEWRDSKALNN